MTTTIWFGNDCLDDDYVNDFEGIVTTWSARRSTAYFVPKFEGKGYPTAEESELDEILDEMMGWTPEPEPKVLFMDELPPKDASFRETLKAGYEFMANHKLGEHLASYEDKAKVVIPTPRTWQQAFGTGSMFSETTATKPGNPDDERTVTIGALKGIAAGLMSGGDGLGDIELYDGTNEYLRGMSELIGRALLDLLGLGDGTHENAEFVADEIVQLTND